MEPEHVHKWKFKKKAVGMLRYCACGERILEIAQSHKSILDEEYKPEPPKGTKRKRL